MPSMSLHNEGCNREEELLLLETSLQRMNFRCVLAKGPQYFCPYRVQPEGSFGSHAFLLELADGNSTYRNR